MDVRVDFRCWLVGEACLKRITGIRRQVRTGKNCPSWGFHDGIAISKVGSMEAIKIAMMIGLATVPRLVALHSKSVCSLSRLALLHAMALPLLSSELINRFIFLGISHLRTSRFDFMSSPLMLLLCEPSSSASDADGG